jgi:DNA repair photolyase
MSNNAIYQPKGKAGEYAKWACNFYVGCLNGCTYCYLKKGIGCKTLGGNVPTLKKCFKDENHALEVFEKELKANVVELRKHGLFFSFTTDPMLPETRMSTWYAFEQCYYSNVRLIILTKRTDFMDDEYINDLTDEAKKYIAFGFTLTGHDELEPNASTNSERIEAMKKLHDAGFKTWASIEPIIDFGSSFDMISMISEICDLYKIGLESGKIYHKRDLHYFVHSVVRFYKDDKIYFKDSLLKAAGIDRKDLPFNCVDSDYNIFNE